MNSIDRTLPIGICFVGGLCGLSIGRFMDRLKSVVHEPGHYRVESALNRVAAAESVPTVGWVIGSALICLVLWLFLRRFIAHQGRRAAALKALMGLVPFAAACVIMVGCGDPAKQSGRLWLTAAAGLACAGTALVVSYIVLWPVWNRKSRWRPRSGFVWATSIALYLVLGFWMSLIMEPTGDEPHYLLGMHSLIHDGDLNIANNHANQDYLHFYPTKIHHAQMLETRRGITLPKHSIGLMLIGAPFYALGGRMAVSLMGAVICALLSGMVFHYISRLAGATVGILTWSGTLVAAPLVLYPGQIYPNALTGLLLGLALYAAEKEQLVARVAAGLAVGFVPWFHLGTWPLAFGALCLMMWRERRRARVVGLVALVPWLGMLGFHYYFWGSATPPVATYGRFSFSSIPAAFAGQLLDQEAGILWIAPLWWLLIPGFVVSARHGTRRLHCLLLIGWLLYVSTFSWWYGGWCPTGRFWLPALVSLSIPLGEVILRLGRIAPALWIGGAVPAIVLTSFPFFRYNAHDGSHSILDALGNVGQSVALYIPSVVNSRPTVWIIWGVLTGTWTWYSVRKLRRSQQA